MGKLPSLSSPLARLLGEDKKGISGLVAAGGCRRGLLLLFLRVLPSRASGRPLSLRSRGHPVRRANRRETYDCHFTDGAMEALGREGDGDGFMAG